MFVRVQSDSELDYEFNLSPTEGALLILPEGAERHVLRNESCFLNYVIQYGPDWYRFTQERRGWIISRDSLYLITGFYKARSWSLATYESATGANGFSTQFRATQLGGDDIDISTAYTWRTARALNRRIGPIENYGMPNQGVFIRGFKIALKAGFPGMKRVTVKAGAPSARSMHVKSSSLVPGNAWMSNLWGQKRSVSTSAAEVGGGNVSNVATGQASSIVLNEEVPIEIRRLPEVS